MLENLSEVLKPRSYNCAVRTLLYSLDESDQEILRDNLVNPDIANNSLARALRGVGFRIADTSIRRHRLGECSCSRI